VRAHAHALRARTSRAHTALDTAANHATTRLTARTCARNHARALQSTPLYEHDLSLVRPHALRAGLCTGGEFAVLDGMHELLLQRKVELMSWEYSFGWHKPLYYGEYNASHSYADCKRASPQLT
jgi:hypothetical protein